MIGGGDSRSTLRSGAIVHVQELVSRRNPFPDVPWAFSAGELLGRCGAASGGAELADRLRWDRGVLCLGAEQDGAELFITCRDAWAWLLFFNLRLARRDVTELPHEQLVVWANNQVRRTGRWRRLPEALASFALAKGLFCVGRRHGTAVFPVALVLRLALDSSCGRVGEVVEDFAAGDGWRAQSQNTAEQAVEKVLDRLRPRERWAVSVRDGLEPDSQTLAELGLEQGISRERVRQIYLKGKKRLRHPRIFPLALTGLLRAVVEQSGSLLFCRQGRAGADAAFLAERCGVPSVQLPGALLVGMAPPDFEGSGAAARPARRAILRAGEQFLSAGDMEMLEDELAATAVLLR